MHDHFFSISIQPSDPYFRGVVRSKETIGGNKSTTKVERGPTLGMRLEKGIRAKSQVTLAHINTTGIAPAPPVLITVTRLIRKSIKMFRRYVMSKNK